MTQLAHTISDNTYKPEVLLPAFKTGIATANVLSNIGAVDINMSLPSTMSDTITIPVMGRLTGGGFQEVTTDGVAVTASKVSDTKQTAAIKHYSAGVEITWLGSVTSSAGDKHAAASRLLLEDASSKMEAWAIEKAKVETGVHANYIYDGSSKTIDKNTFLQARALLGEGASRDMAGIIVHSAVELQLRMLSDASGRALWADPTSDTLPRWCGLPVYVSDRLTSSGGVHTSLLLRKKSIVAYFAGEKANVVELYDPSTDIRKLWYHLYGFVEKLDIVDNFDRPGVIIVKTKV